jgi:predicted DNA binding CopG/RHH family protein
MSEKTTRDRQLNLRLNEEEFKRLEQVAKHYGIGEQEALRFLLKREADKVLRKLR